MPRRLSLLVVLCLGATLALPGSVSAGGGCAPDAGLGKKSSSKTSVAIAGCEFVDNVTFVDPGGRITWVNQDIAPHTVTGAGLSWGNEDQLEQGDEVTYTFEKEGVYPYYCALHAWMASAIVVGDPTSTEMLGGGGVERVDVAAPVSSAEDEGAPAESGGLAPGVVALSIAVALAVAFGATRYASSRRVAGPA